jgi:hypothetical protein
MKKITILASNDLVNRARMTAKSDGTTLEKAILHSLKAYPRKRVAVREYEELMKKLRRTVRTNAPYTRDKMNER